MERSGPVRWTRNLRDVFLNVEMIKIVVERGLFTC